MSTWFLAPIAGLKLPTQFSFQLYLLCCGSGSALIWQSWIRIRIGNADPDPGAMKLTKINKKPGLLPLKLLLYLRRYVILAFYLLQVHFSCKFQLFVTLKSDQDPNPHALAPWIRIEIRNEI
jgi:hypothetical protein